MNETFLIGAILGSGLFIMFLRPPAERILARVKARLPRDRG